jgi:hypothetical protein
MGAADDAGGFGDNAEDMAAEREEQYDDAADTGADMDGPTGEPYDEPTEQASDEGLEDEAGAGEPRDDENVDAIGEEERFEETGEEDLGER